MKFHASLSVMIALLFALGSNSKTNDPPSMEEFPISVVCDNGQNHIRVGLNPQTNRAQLYFYKKGETNPVNIHVFESFGRNSYSSVSITTTKTGASGENKTMVLSAQSSESFLVSHVSQFTLSLTKIGNGFMAKQLVYEKGVYEYPDSMLLGTVDFENLSCSMQHLG